MCRRTHLSGWELVRGQGLPLQTPPWPAPTFLFHLSAALVLGKGVQALQHLDQPALPEAAAQAGLGAGAAELCSRACPPAQRRAQ